MRARDDEVGTRRMDETRQRPCCIPGEHAALDAYEEALHGMLPPTVAPLVEAQQEAMQEAVDRIRAIDMGDS